MSVKTFYFYVQYSTLIIRRDLNSDVAGNLSYNYTLVSCMAFNVITWQKVNEMNFIWSTSQRYRPRS